MSELDYIGAQLDKAARHLNPIMLNRLDDGLPIIKATHDALNALAAARLQLDLLQQTLEEGASS